MKQTILIEKAPKVIKYDKLQISTYNEFGDLQSYNNMPSLEVFSEDSLFWSENGLLNSFNDMPSSIRDLNSQIFYGDFFHLEWSKNGTLHRDGDKPAVIGNDGTMGWYKNGALHREGDNPAIISEINNLKVWAKNGFISREENKPNLIIGENKIWVSFDANTRSYYLIKIEKSNNGIINFLLNNCIKISLGISAVLFILSLF
jgi:hypothetical protein